MSTRVTVTLTDETYRRAEYLARLTGRDVEDILTEALSISLQSFDSHSPLRMPVADLSDGEVLALADSTMEASQDQRMSELLYKQQAGELTPDEQPELTALMQVYQHGLLRKAQALNEAVRRGLREPLEP
jgi:hypothetical protein